MMKFYVVVRTDLASMTPGRVAAQVSHATSQLHEMAWAGKDLDRDLWDAFREWVGAGDFGTTIVLEHQGDPAVLLDPVDAEASNIVIDDSYSVRDGSVVHKIRLTTCCWALVDDENNCQPYPELNLYFGDTMWS